MPELPEHIASELVRIIGVLRGMQLKKLPSVAETIDWTNALVALNTLQLDPASVQDTLGVLLKHQDYLVRMQNGDTAKLLDELKAKALL